MYVWHVCFYPSIIAASAARRVDVNYGKGGNNGRASEGQV